MVVPPRASGSDRFRNLRRDPLRIVNCVIGIVTDSLEHLSGDLVCKGEPGKDLRLPLAVRHRHGSLQSDRPGDQPAEILDRLRDLIKIPVKADDDGHIAYSGEEKLDHIQADDKVDPFLLGAHPRAEHHLPWLHARTGCGHGLTWVPPPTGVKEAVNATPAARQVLRKKVRMAKWIAEQRTAYLVEILAIDENQDLSSRVRRECSDRWIRHLAI